MAVTFTLEQLWHPVPGGTARAALGLVEQLVQCGDIDLTAYSARHVRGPEKGWKVPDNVKWRRSSLPRPVLYESWLRRGKPIVGNERTIVHSTTLFPVPSRGKSIVTIHDLAFLDDPSVFTIRGARLFAQCVDMAKATADAVVVPSQHTWDAAVRHGFDASQLRLIPLATKRPLDVESGARHRPYVLWVGTVEPRKNLIGLIDAFRSVANDIPHDLVLVGPQGWGADIAAHTTGIEDRVVRYGFATDHELAQLYRGADVFAFPSLAEGFGLPVLEAMSYGVAVVTSSGTATEELVAGGGGLAVDPYDSKSLGRTIAEVVSDRTMHDVLCRGALQRSTEYSWKAAADLTVAMYRDLTA